jgi:aminoglycoside phosphotransferase family enzyme/predicted kinase
MCEAELRLNRRTAPEIYLRVAAVTRAADGRLSLDGAGEPVDWVVVMRRFDQAGLFDRLAVSGRLTPELIDDLSAAIDRFQRLAEVRKGADQARELARVIDIAEGELGADPTMFDPETVARVVAALRRELDRRAGLLGERSDAGFVRLLHGDLHLRNVCLIDGRPTLFDAIEFDERLSVSDVLYDLAFLLMDLGHRRRRDLANRVLNSYLERTDDDAGLALLPLFLAYRALIRAYVGGPMARSQLDPARRSAAIAEAQWYFREAESLLCGSAPILVGLGGVSGTGKSTVARRLAPEIGSFPGAVVLRTDVIRKRLRRREAIERLPAEAYRPEISVRVYAELERRTMTLLQAGRSVVADAVWNHADARSRLAAVAGRSGVAFIGLWLTAPPEVLRARVAGRRNDASDADVTVLEAQLRQPLGAMDWVAVDAGGDANAPFDRARELVSLVDVHQGEPRAST